MFNLNDILQASQGGQAMENLARQYGISLEQANAAVQALMPAMSMGLQQQAGNMQAFSAILTKMNDPLHRESFETPDPTPAAAGEEAVADIFGSSANAERVAQHAAAAAGLPVDMMSQIMQSLASTMLGGLAASLQNQGLGGLFGQLANAAQQGGLGGLLGQMMGGAQGLPGGLGSVLGQVLGGGAPQAGQPQAQGGLGGMLGDILGGMMGGGRQPSATKQPEPEPEPPQASPLPGGFDPATIQAGMEALGKMFQTGGQPGGAQQAGLQDLLTQIFGGKR